MLSVYLSPSTQENNIGAANYGTEEFRCNCISDVIEKVLIQHNIKVYRNKPTMSLADIVKDSNSKNANIHFAIHTNAFDKETRGCEIFCFRKGGEGEKIANEVYKHISALTPTADRGVKEGYNFYGAGKHLYELHKTTMPASLIEIEFHDNYDGAKWIISNIEKIGTEIAKGILDYFKIKYIVKDEFEFKKKYYELIQDIKNLISNYK